MANILDEIIAYKKQEVAQAKRRRTLRQLEQDMLEAAPLRPFLGALERKSGAGQFALIAEIKKASPSKGLIRADFNPPELARAYEAGGAACLSVLTDAPSFQGDPEFLRQAKAACALPVLRKDFMIDPYQVIEARAWGADCILIIMARTENSLAAELAAAARETGMNALVEVHNAPELERAMRLDCKLIGVNNRNLKSFETRLETTEELAPLVPDDHIVVGESGISTHEDLLRLSQVNVSSFLVGESLMRQPDVANAARKLLNGEAA